MARGDFRARTRESQLKEKERLKKKQGPSKYITTGRGKRVLNPKWTAWNKKKTDASDLKIRQKENEEEQRKYIREEKPDGTVTVRKRTAVDSMDDIKKYSDSAYRKNQKETKKDPYTGKDEVTSDNAYEKSKTKLNIGSSTQKKKEPTKTTTKTANRDKKNFPGGKEGYSNLEKAGARQSSARNSIARQAYLRKKAKLKIKKKDE